VPQGGRRPVSGVRRISAPCDFLVALGEDNVNQKPAGPQPVSTGTSVFVVDDHALVRDGLINIIDLEPDLTVVGSGTGSAETMRDVKQVRPRVLVVDLEMPVIRGADFIDMAREAVPGIRVIACSMHASYGYISEALKRGADGYVLKSSPGELLIQAIRSVAAGHGFIDPALQADVVRLIQRRGSSEADTDLTAQELQVIRLAAEGLTNQKIAERVGHSVESVKLRLRWSFRKLGAKDRASAVAAAIRRGLI
jgi:DNA-binding NarL/FixJ family response regulator